MPKYFTRVIPLQFIVSCSGEVIEGISDVDITLPEKVPGLLEKCLSPYKEKEGQSFAIRFKARSNKGTVFKLRGP